MNKNLIDNELPFEESQKDEPAILSQPLLPLRLLGMGLLFTWDWSLTTDLLMSGTGELWHSGVNMTVIMVAVQVLVLIMCAVLSGKIGSISNKKTPLYSCGHIGGYRAGLYSGNSSRRLS